MLGAPQYMICKPVSATSPEVQKDRTPGYAEPAVATRVGGNSLLRELHLKRSFCRKNGYRLYKMAPPKSFYKMIPKNK